MTIPVIVIRPEPGLSRTLEAGRELGLEMVGFPLFETEPLSWRAPDPARFDGLLIGSANALRHGGPQLDAFRHLPVYAVGERTAAEASAHGFEVVQTGEGGLQGLLERLTASNLRLLRLAGEAHVELKPVEGVDVETIPVYRVTTQPFPADLCHTLELQAVVLLHSAEAARHFESECDRLRLDRTKLSLAVIGPRVIPATGDNWRQVRASAEPNDAALLALAAEMCQRCDRATGSGRTGSTL